MTVKIRPLDLHKEAPGQSVAGQALGRPVRALATAVFFGMLAVYFFTLSADFAPDGVAFARLVDLGQLTRPGFFQAEHLLYPFIGWLWYQGWRFFGFDHGSLVPLQILNALFGAAGVTAVFLAARLALVGRRASLMPSLFTALLVGSTHGYWLHATDAEDMIPAVATVCVGFVLVLAIRRGAVPSRKLIVATGLTLGLAPLLHGTEIFFWPIAAAGLYWPRRDRRIVIQIGTLAVAVVAGTLLVVAVLAVGVRSPGDLWGWLTSAPRVGVWGHLAPRNLPVGLRTAADAIVNLNGGPRLGELRAGTLLWTNLLAVLTAVSLLAVGLLAATVLIRSWRFLPDRSLAWLTLAWVALSGLFALFWAPEDIQFWVTMVIPIVFLLTFAYLLLQDDPQTRHDLLASVTLFGYTALLTINAVTGLVPRSDIRLNMNYQRMLCLNERLGSADLVISAGWDWPGTYLPYFTKLDYVSLTDVAVGPGRRDPAATQAIVAERIAAARTRGGRVWTVHLFDLAPAERDWFEKSSGLKLADLADLRGAVVGECQGELIRGGPPS